MNVRSGVHILLGMEFMVFTATKIDLEKLARVSFYGHTLLENSHNLTTFVELFKIITIKHMNVQL